MKDGISGAPVPSGFPLANTFNTQALNYGFWPCVAAAVGYNETLSGYKPSDAATVVSADGGHGIMQLTASYPTLWTIPDTNIAYALGNFLVPAFNFWHDHMGMSGDALVRCILAEYNAGRSQALDGHEQGDVDKYTTNNYAARGLETYHTLISGSLPPLP